MYRPHISLIPKISILWTEGYSLHKLWADLLAGLSVAVVALPLSMALAIASGSTPDKGLLTAIVAGFLISAMGGSRYQVSGPTAAFIVVVLGTITTHGYDGMLLATLIAGALLIIAGALRLGTYVKYIPYPVVTGFTAGIALSILLGQLKELFGISFGNSPAPHGTIELVTAYAQHWQSLSLPTLFVGLGTLGLMLFLRRYRSRWPIFLIGAFTGAMIIWLSAYMGQPLESVATIQSRFGTLPNDIPLPHLPDWSWAKVKEVFPSAVTIAFLAGVEALLSAVVADGMTGRRHRSNIELVAQGTGNIASAMFGGLPATGAIARTATNIRAGAQTPLAGMFHAVFLLLFILVAAPLAGWIPLATLAAILVIVAWNISELDRFKHLLKAPVGDRVILISTFLLTVFADLTVAIEVGVILAAFIFMHRMSEVGKVAKHGHEAHAETLMQDSSEETADSAAAPLPTRRELPKGVEVYRMSGPFFFGVTGRVTDALAELRDPPKVLIMDMEHVPMIDASGAASLHELYTKTAKNGGHLILAGVKAEPRTTLRQMGIHTETGGQLHYQNTLDNALMLAEKLIEQAG